MESVMRHLQAAVFLTLASAAAFTAAPAHAQAQFEGAGETSELDCGGESATIEGASNVLTITGACTNLHVIGASNRINVDLAKTSSIQVEGAGNEIYWIAPGTAKPRLRVTGAANRISRRR
ncbi:DUF3060 domain-containing protein [Sphingomonas sp. S2-65]|uniref:DUF3060 domain-containing protein n=1 Tax=Sphingomonas sp. S2-65 TaxID=2903960 RepID=UPI001F3E4C57|nr:DUF3060 domain-containing protein [Sphingomonas sp. S2-65]UYY59396.1 DUF3060 domain-containing protein [Sphingomonas sp. S2-65]